MSEQECTALLMKFIIDDYDYQRMIDLDYDGIDEKKSYDEFLEWNITCLKEYSNEEYIFFKVLCQKIDKQQIEQMDMESCLGWKTYSLFFDINKNLVIVHPR